MSIIRGLLNKAAAAKREVTTINQFLDYESEKAIKGTGRGLLKMGSDAAWAARHPVARLQNKGPFAVPQNMELPFGPGGPLGAGLRGAALEDAVKAGAAQGGKVTTTIMSAKQLAERRAAAASKQGMHTADIVEQHGADGLLLRNGQEGVRNMLDVAKHPGHGNTTYIPTAHNAQLEKALEKGPEGSRTAFIITKQGKIYVGGPGSHHDEIIRGAKARGEVIPNPKDVIQGEIHHEQDLGHLGQIPARIHTTRSLDPRAAEGKLSNVQNAAMTDWLEKANKPGTYHPKSGNETVPGMTNGLYSRGDPGDIMRANRLMRQLAKEPNPLGKDIPSAFKLAGMSDDAARNEASRLGGGPTRPQDYVSKRKTFGVKPGGMTPSVHEERVIVPSRTTPPDKPREILRGPRRAPGAGR